MKKIVFIVIAIFFFLTCTPTANAQGTWTKIWGAVENVILGYEQIDSGTLMYAVQESTGDIFQYRGTPLSWERIGGPGKSFVIAGGGLYGISPDSSGVYKYTGTPGQWKKVGGAAQAIYGVDSYGPKALFATNPTTGNIYSYDLPADKWTEIGGPGKMFAVGRENLYGLSPDGSGVYKYSGTPGKWDKVGGPAENIYAGGDALFATNPQTGDIYSYDENSTKWTKIGGPGKTFSVNVNGQLYGLSPDGSGVYKYTGAPGKWDKIGGSAGNIYAGGKRICATNQNQELWCLSDVKDASGEDSPLTFEYAPGRSGPTQKIDFFMSDKIRHDTLTYEKIDDLAIFEGDIILGRSADLQKRRPRKSMPQCIGDICSSTQPLSVIFGETYLWPGGVIPFEVDPRFGSVARTEINAGINMLTGATNLLLRPRNGEQDYIVFTPSDGCSSYVGRQTGRQEVRLVNPVNATEPSCRASGVAHEILHAAGLWHEQSRGDRDENIRILWQNIEADKGHNFEMHASDGVDLGPYDLQSIMHYGATAFGRRDPATGLRLQTIETIPPGGIVGGATQLSNNDVAGINQLYPMSSTQRFIPIPNLVFGLRHSLNQANDFIKPFVQFGTVAAQRIRGGDLGAPSGQGFNWWMIPTETPLTSIRLEEIPPGVVLGMWHSKNMSQVPGDFRLVSMQGGDLGAPSGEGFVWYENQNTDHVNWNIVNMLPPYTVVGLKHSANQRNKTFQWSDGRIYDPLVVCPDGFDRKNGGDLGAPSGTGFYWCEKRRS